MTIVMMFTFLYLPHVFVLSLFHEPFPRSAAATMILSESAVIVSLIAESFLTEHQVVDIFDITLLSRTKRIPGLKKRVETMIKAARIMDIDDAGNRRLGRHIYNPYLKFKVGIRMGVYFILELPLCLIPVVGTGMFLAMQGEFVIMPRPEKDTDEKTAYHLGPLCHYRYFQLLGWDDKQKYQFIQRNRFRYWLFGLVHVSLQLIPVASIFFLFSTGTGAALWAVDYEKRMWSEQNLERGQPGADWSPSDDEEEEGVDREEADDETPVSTVMKKARVLVEGAEGPAHDGWKRFKIWRR
jgi:hypothetical protein